MVFVLCQVVRFYEKHMLKDSTMGIVLRKNEELIEDKIF